MESDTSKTSPRTTGRPASQDASADLAAPLSTAPATDAKSVTIDRSSWIQEDDSFREVMFMSATGKHPVIGGPSIPLYRPNRFHSISPLRSIVVLLVVVALIISIPIGVVLADRATSNIKIPGVPGVSATNSPSTTTTPTITATPKKK